MIFINKLKYSLLKKTTIFPPTRNVWGSRVLLNEVSYLQQWGWYRSFRERMAIDADGRPIPWLTYPAIQFLTPRLQLNMRLFEFGCGNSTRFWSQHVDSVVSCEHDTNWYATIDSTLLPNVTLLQRDLVSKAYQTSICDYRDAFEIVVIDGRERVTCALNSLQALTEDGIIVFDNADREKYAEGLTFLHQQGFRQINFHGMAPISIFPSCTAIFYRQHNCLNL